MTANAIPPFAPALNPGDATPVADAEAELVEVVSATAVPERTLELLCVLDLSVLDSRVGEVVRLVVEIITLDDAVRIDVLETEEYFSDDADEADLTDATDATEVEVASLVEVAFAGVDVDAGVDVEIDVDDVFTAAAVVGAVVVSSSWLVVFSIVAVAASAVVVESAPRVTKPAVGPEKVAAAVT